MATLRQLNNARKVYKDLINVQKGKANKVNSTALRVLRQNGYIKFSTKLKKHIILPKGSSVIRRAKVLFK